MRAFGRLDVLVNAAGISKMVPHARLHGVSAEDFQRIYADSPIAPAENGVDCKSLGMLPGETPSVPIPLA